MGKKGSVFIAMGLLLLSAALLLTLYNIWDSHRAGAAAQQTVAFLKTMLSPPEGSAQENTFPATSPQETSPEAFTEALCASEPELSTTTPEAVEEEDGTDPDEPPLPFQQREMPTTELNGYNYIGVLEVPSLELTLPVMEQWDYDRLKLSPCRFSGNVYEDDLVICGHNYSQHFGPLKYVPLGTEIHFTDAEGTLFLYCVSSFETVGPNDVERMITGDWDLTLFTCNTNGQTRCAIRCDRIE